MTVMLEYSAPDAAWVAVLVRDGEPWYLDGALVGMDSTPGDAVTELIGMMRYLARHGTNFLTTTTLPLDDRKWLFGLLDHGVSDEETYTALNAALKLAERTTP